MQTHVAHQGCLVLLLREFSADTVGPVGRYLEFVLLDGCSMSQEGAVVLELVPTSLGIARAPTSTVGRFEDRKLFEEGCQIEKDEDEEEAGCHGHYQERTGSAETGLLRRCLNFSSPL